MPTPAELQEQFMTAFGSTLSRIERPEDKWIHVTPQGKRIVHAIKRLSQESCTVLLTGPSGVGKSLLAAGLTHVSGKFYTENCSAFPDKTLGYARLHGYKKGAFTGALEDKPSIFTRPTPPTGAHHTIFLDEIGDMPLEMQGQLLRILQDKVITPLGSTEDTTITNVRIVAATNKDLQSLVNKGEFRADLFGRLMEIIIHIPSLTQRQDDALAICDKFQLPKDITDMLFLDHTSLDLYGVRHIQALAKRYQIFGDVNFLT